MKKLPSESWNLDVIKVFVMEVIKAYPCHFNEKRCDWLLAIVLQMGNTRK